jgi:hypothetical protein
MFFWSFLSLSFQASPPASFANAANLFGLQVDISLTQFKPVSDPVRTVCQMAVTLRLDNANLSTFCEAYAGPALLWNRRHSCADSGGAQSKS